MALENKYCPLKDGDTLIVFKKHRKLVVAYKANRAAKDANNRKRGLQRLEKQIKLGKLTEACINNKGYDKYLKMTGNI